MDEEKNSLMTVILGWILAYASYAAITFAVMECLAVISMSYLAIGGTDVSFIQNLGYANGDLANTNANISQAQIMDIFVYFFAGITIISELVGFIIKKAWKKDLALTFKQKLYIGIGIITAINLIGMMIFIFSEPWSTATTLWIFIVLISDLVSYFSLLLFLALRWFSRNLRGI